jgi:hypothetical protein
VGWRLSDKMPSPTHMPVSAASDPKQAIGRAPERLSLEERLALAGKLIALEIYTPEALPLRRIEAIADSVEECVRVHTCG